MTFAGAATVAPAMPGAARPSAAVTPTTRPVARARRWADPERRPRRAPAAGSLRRSSDRAIGVAVDVGSTVGTPFPWGGPAKGRVTGVRRETGLSGPSAPAVFGVGRLWTPRRPGRKAT